MNIRKTACMLFAAALVVALSGAACAEWIKTPAPDGSLNVRKGPGTSYAVAGWVKNGQEITVIRKGERWSEIRVNATGRSGYVKNTYIVSAPEEEHAFVGAVYAIGSVKTRYAASTVNVRKGPGTAFGVESKAASGERLRILGESGNWYLVETHGGETGYISKNYVSCGVSGTTSAYVHLRSGAGTQFASMGVLPAGTRVFATGVTGSWTEISTEDGTGFIYSKYIK